MKVAKKSPAKRAVAYDRATLTLTGDVYRKIDALRGSQARSAWVQELVEREERRRARDQFAETLRAQYTEKVCRETLALNDQFPVHDR